MRKDDDSIRQIELKVLKWVIIGGGILCFLSLLTGDPMGMCFGIVIGAFIGYMGFLHLSRTLQKSTYMLPERANRYVSSRYNLRMVAMALGLLLAILVEAISLLGVVIGLLLPKFVIYMTQLCDDREFYKRIFRRKEE